jgi:S1-C subfamily serine protease
MFACCLNASTVKDGGEIQDPTPVAPTEATPPAASQADVQASIPEDPPAENPRSKTQRAKTKMGDESFFCMAERDKKDQDWGVKLSMIGEDEDDFEGLMIDAITPNGPFSKANMNVGDKIISIDGEEESDLMDYPEMMEAMKTSLVIGMKVMRKTD